MRKYIALVLLVASFSGWALADDRPSSSSSISTNDHGDPILKAMLAELKRSQEKLQFGQFQRPYFIDYQVTEVQDYSSDAILGAIRHATGIRLPRVPATPDRVLAALQRKAAE